MRGFIQLHLADVVEDVIDDSVDSQVVVGPMGGPIESAAVSKRKVFAFDYAIVSKRRGFFVGTIEIETQDTEDFDITVQSIRNRLVKTLKRRRMHVIDSSTYLQFAHVCEGLWPDQNTKRLRIEIEQRREIQKKNAEGERERDQRKRNWRTG